MPKIDFIYSYNPIDYDFAIDFMHAKVQKIIEENENQAVWLLEHPSIYTLGRSAVSTDIKNMIDIPFINTDRGGKITYHGPGQKIVYVMLDLKKLFDGKIDLKLFIRMLENWIISIFTHNNIVTYADKENIGIWIHNDNGNKKITSIGIKVKKWVSYHGLAINVNPDMSFFNNINPCGIHDCRMTSIYMETKKCPESKELDKIIKNCFFDTFNLKLDKEYEI
ncbi:lipoyl(octanoyl) transferase LipB [Candidatus Bandiella numerosa]|jgi:lipoyl(octanoyl) transferase|uniref:lipoyl(octanoyl) transferase LipB n=1 Tax=Candidatus Bandiella numerosa TaxID=2570586 RepID=UPI00249E3D5E|nr:lipoyl(octanoyl) transferase LipB [Candidatus Bandiella numerosa]WHA05518.1 lipoyl(octanoyl) transferase LipB [Candidatus Bandiella numerosa]